MSEPKRRRREGGPAKVDNGLKFSKFRPMPAINQKNYSTGYLKKESQLLVNRNAESGESSSRKESTPRDTPAKDEEDDDEAAGSKLIVLHLGSRNIRAGFASDVYPKTIPMAIAKKVRKDVNTTDNAEGFDTVLEGAEDFDEAYATVKSDFKERMRFYKRRIAPSAEDNVKTFNARQLGEQALDQDDGDEDEVAINDDVVLGPASLRQGDNYKVFWPIQFGNFNETDYKSAQSLLGDIILILKHIVHNELEVPKDAVNQYGAVIVVPDLYDRTYVVEMIELLLADLRFEKVAVIQEALAATFGAGISSACIVDIGAQTTTVSCVDDGQVVPDSRVNLKYGGDDITVAFMHLLQRSNFPYKEIDLTRSYDFQLADSLKSKYGTVNDAQIAVQLYSFYVRTPGQPVFKYDFKTFDEVMLPVLGLFYPELFSSPAKKLESKYRLFPRSVNVYDDKYNDPISDAMLDISLGTLAVNGENYLNKLEGIAEEAAEAELAAKAAEAAEAAEAAAKAEAAKAEVSGTAEPDEAADEEPATDIPEPDEDMDDMENKTVPPSRAATPSNGAAEDSQAATTASDKADAVEEQLRKLVDEARSISPVDIPAIALDHAIVESITQAVAKVPSTTVATFYENLMVVGGGAKFSGFNLLLTDRLGIWTRDKAKEIEEIAVMAIPRDMDPEIITWKGGSVFAKLKLVDELWITESDWNILGSRLLQYKAIFQF